MPTPNRTSVSVRLYPAEMARLEALCEHYQGGPGEEPVSLGEAGRRAIMAEHERMVRRQDRRRDA